MELKGLNLLVVEDDDINQDVIKLFLRNLLVPDMASNGIEAIEKASNKEYGLILMDINLKDMNGITVLKEIKKLPGYESVPVVAVTAYAMNSDRVRLLSEGFNDYIAKPFSKKELLAKLEDLN